MKKIFLFTISILLITSSYAQPLIIAHKGGEYWEGDNFSYITNSLKQGADIIELDIKLKNNQYIIKHSLFQKKQGTLSEALTKINNASIYLDIKDNQIDPNDLIKYVKERNNNKIIIGSFNKELLKKINKDENITINYHCISFLCSIKTAKEVDADWINPIPYFISKKKIKEIQDNGFKFVPGGTENSEKQLKYTKLGAHVISTYQVKKFKEKI